jgi:hypothetical protein
MGWGEWFAHTVTAEAKDCAFCHENKEVLCEGCKGEILGEGGSFISQETIDRIYGVSAPTEAPTQEPPGFEIAFGIVALAIAIYLGKSR